MKNKKEIQEELEALSPSFSKMKKEDVFKVPANYFDNLPNQIFAELDLDKEEIIVEQQPSWWNAVMDNVMQLLQPRIAIGFATLLLLIASVFYFKNAETVVAPLLAELTTEEVEAYVLENIDDFEEELFYEIAAETESLNYDSDQQEFDSYLEEMVDELDDDMLEELL